MGFRNKFIIQVNSSAVGFVLSELGKKGIIKADATLWPNQYIYWTNLAEDKLPLSHQYVEVIRSGVEEKEERCCIRCRNYKFDDDLEISRSCAIKSEHFSYIETTRNLPCFELETV